MPLTTEPLMFTRKLLEFALILLVANLFEYYFQVKPDRATNSKCGKPLVAHPAFDGTFSNSKQARYFGFRQKR